MAEVVVILSAGLIRILSEMDDPTQWLKEPTGEALELLYEQATTYPPERPGQRYRRTFKLRNSWKREQVLSGSVLGKVSSQGVAYSRYVMDAERQAWMHQGRWKTVQDISAEQEEPVRRIYQRYAAQELAGA